MSKYESVLVLEPNLMKKQIQEIVNKVTNKIEQVAEITKMEELGERKLAYEIRKNKNGYYIVYQFILNKEVEDKKTKTIESIERYLRTIEEIMRFIVVLEG